jgi:hypothetical protein
MVVNRELMVEKIGRFAAVALLEYDAYGDGPFTFELLAERNRRGWTMEESRPLNTVIRAEGVVLSPGELRRAWLLARELAPVL